MVYQQREFGGKWQKPNASKPNRGVLVLGRNTPEGRGTGLAGAAATSGRGDAELRSRTTSHPRGNRARASNVTSARQTVLALNGKPFASHSVRAELHRRVEDSICVASPVLHRRTGKTCCPGFDTDSRNRRLEPLPLASPLGTVCDRPSKLHCRPRCLSTVRDSDSDSDLGFVRATLSPSHLCCTDKKISMTRVKSA